MGVPWGLPSRCWRRIAPLSRPSGGLKGGITVGSKERYPSRNRWSGWSPTPPRVQSPSQRGHLADCEWGHDAGGGESRGRIARLNSALGQLYWDRPVNRTAAGSTSGSLAAVIRPPHWRRRSGSQRPSPARCRRTHAWPRPAPQPPDGLLCLRLLRPVASAATRPPLKPSHAPSPGTRTAAPICLVPDCCG